MCIHNTINKIFGSDTFDNSDTDNLAINEDTISVSIIEKYSDFFIKKRQVGQRVEKSIVKLYTLEDSIQSYSTPTFTDITTRQIDDKCKDNNDGSCDEPIDIDIRYSGLNFQVFAPSGENNESGTWIPNHTIELSKQGKYNINYLSSDSSGHPLAIQTVQEPFDSGFLVNSNIFSQNPLYVGDSIYVEVPDSGIFISGIEYKRLYYTCASGNLFGHPSIQNEINIQIIGTNDAPIITDIKDNFKIFVEEVDSTGQILQTNGKLIFQDLDYGDNLTPIITPLTFFGPLTSVGNIDVSGNGPSGIIVSKGGTVEIDWSYRFGPAAWDQLRHNQIIPIRYNIRLTDGHEISNAAPLNLYLIGTNDPVIIETGNGTLTSGTIYELPASNVDAGNFLHSTEGYIYFEDKDLGDDHFAFYQKTIGGDYGVLGLEVENANSRVRWVYDIYDWEMNALLSGQMVRQEYFITIYDSNYSLDTIAINIDLVGADDIVAQNEPVFSTLIEQYIKQTGVYEKITNEPIYMSGSWWPSGYNQSNDISFITDVNYSGYTSGIPFGSGDLLRMFNVDVSGEDPDKKIVWQFDSTPEAFNYLPHGEILNIKYIVDFVEDQEGGIIDIKDAFVANFVQPIFDHILNAGSHNYIDEKYWKADQDVPLKYGGLDDIKVYFDKPVKCLDINNFNYIASGVLLLPQLKMPLHPEYPSYISDVVTDNDRYNLFNVAGNFLGEWTKFLYPSKLETDNTNRKYRLSIGKNYEEDLQEYDEPAEINPFLLSTKWPAEKVKIEFSPSFIGVSGIHYTSGDAPEINIISSDGEFLCQSSAFEYRNISLVDIRANLYPVSTFLSNNYTSSVVYTKCNQVIVPYYLSEDNQIVGGLEYRAKNLIPTFSLSSFSLVVQNREWHRDAGHAMIKTDIRMSGEDIIDILEIGDIVENFGRVPWVQGYGGAVKVNENGDLESLDRISKLGSIRGTFASVCACDRNGDIDPNCECSTFLGPNYIYFPGGTDISDLSVGMNVQGPFVPYGTYIEEIFGGPSNPGECGPYIRISHYVDDEDPETGANFGNCSRYYYFTFSDFNTGEKNPRLYYPLRSNKGQLFEYGIFDGISIYAPVFISYAYYEKWRQIPLPNPLQGVITIARHSTSLYPTVDFLDPKEGGTGYARSYFDPCYRPVSLSAYESKMDQPGSLYNLTYSALNCKGTFPFYDLASFGGGLCPDRLDPWCGCSYLLGGPNFPRYWVGGPDNFNMCFADDILAYDDTSFFNYDIVLGAYGPQFTWTAESGAPRSTYPPNDWDYLIKTSGTGYEGNSTFPAGTVADSFRRPRIDGIGSSRGVIDPTIETIRNGMFDERPKNLLRLYHPFAADINGATAEDIPFRIYEPHGYTHFLFIYKRRLGWGEPKYYYDQYGQEFGDRGVFYIAPDISNPEIVLPYPSGSCAQGYPFLHGKASVEADVILDNLHINVVQNIHGKYPENDQSIDINNSVVFSGLLVPPSGNTVINLSTPLYNPDEEYGELTPCSTRRLHVRKDTYHGNVNVGNGEENPWYCYERPEKIKTCEDLPTKTSTLRLRDFGYTIEDMDDYIEAYYSCCRPQNYGCFCPFAGRFDRFGFTSFPESTQYPQHIALYGQELGIQNSYQSDYYWTATLDLTSYNCECATTAIVGSDGGFQPTQEFVVFPPPTGLSDCCQYPANVPCPVMSRSLGGGTLFFADMGFGVSLIYYWDKQDKFPGNDLWVKFVVSIGWSPSGYEEGGFYHNLWINQGSRCENCEYCVGDGSYSDFLKSVVCCSPNPENCMSIPKNITGETEFTKVECGAGDTVSLTTSAGSIISNASFFMKGDCIQSIVLDAGEPLSSSDANCDVGIPYEWRT